MLRDNNRAEICGSSIRRESRPGGLLLDFTFGAHQATKWCKHTTTEDLPSGRGVIDQFSQS